MFVRRKSDRLLEPGKALSISVFDKERHYEIAHQVELINEAGLIHGSVTPLLGGEPAGFVIRRLTWEGHDFLDSIRDESIWNSTKTMIVEKGGSFTFDVVKAVATSFAMSAMGLG